MKASIRRIALAAALAGLLAADSALTYGIATRRHVRAGAAVSASIAAEDEDPMTRFRTEREQLRASQTAQLNEIIHDDDTDGETRMQAQRQLLELMKTSEQELTLEGMLQSRGYGEALVTVGGNSVNVLLRREFVTQQESAVILELVMRETGVTGGNVKIIPVF